MQEEFKERTKGWKEEDIQAIETEIKSRNPIKELQKRCKMAKIINETEKERKTQEENKEETKNEDENYKEKEEIKILQKQIKRRN
ncbi:hypothetical protein, conserved [Entamoeba histolytica]